jgi:hypothetical protein
MGLYGNRWEYVGLYGNRWEYMGIYGIIWDCMGIDGNIWDSIIDDMDIIKLDFRSGDMGLSWNGGTPTAGSFIKENPKQKWIIWGYLYFRKPPYIN